MSASVQPHKTTQANTVNVSATDYQKEHRNAVIKGVAIGTLLIGSPYIIGAPMWAVGNQQGNDNLVLAGKVFVIGGAVFEGLIATFLLTLKFAFSRGVGH